jgi:hypothetical protein
MIVGRKIETYLETVCRGPRDFIVTKHAVVEDLHATKGWRTIVHHRERQARTAPPSWREVADNRASEYRKH